jgi:hypothetical protein
MLLACSGLRFNSICKRILVSRGEVGSDNLRSYDLVCRRDITIMY